MAVGLAYLMFGLIVSLRVGLASSYDHGDMLMKMVKEADQEQATGQSYVQALSSLSSCQEATSVNEIHYDVYI